MPLALSSTIQILYLKYCFIQSNTTYNYFKKYLVDLSNTGLNCMDVLTHIYFSMVNTVLLHDP